MESTQNAFKSLKCRFFSDVWNCIFCCGNLIWDLKMTQAVLYKCISLIKVSHQWHLLRNCLQKCVWYIRCGFPQNYRIISHDSLYRTNLTFLSATLTFNSQIVSLTTVELLVLLLLWLCRCCYLGMSMQWMIQIQLQPWLTCKSVFAFYK